MLKQFCAASVAVSLASAPVQASTTPAASRSAVATKIRAQVAEIVAGINAKDIGKATKFDAPDLVSMESMRPPSYGAKADHDGLSMAFKYSPEWHLKLIDETVDVAKSADMAIYRSTYDEDSMRDGVPFTHRVNYVAGFRRDPDGLWRVHWSVVCAQSTSHKK